MAGVEVAAAGTRRFEVGGKPVSVALIEGMLQERGAQAAALRGGFLSILPRLEIAA